MNDRPRALGAANLAMAITVVAALLMLTVAAWYYRGGSDPGGAALRVATASTGTPDSAQLRARAEASASRIGVALAGRVGGDISVTSDNATGSLSAIHADIGGDLFPEMSGDRPAEVKVAAFLAQHGGLFGIDDPARQLKLLGVEQDQYGHRHVSYQQMHGPIPVLGAVLKGHVTPDGRLSAINGKFIPGIDVPTRATVSQSDASQLAIAKVAGQQPAAFKDAELSAPEAHLVVYRTNLTRGTAGVNHLAFEVRVGGGNRVREFVYVDASTGKVLDQITGIQGLKLRRVHEANIATPPAWQEGDLRPAIQPAHEDEVVATGQAYNLFFNLSGGRRSWDGHDATLITVNNDPTIVCPNANWNGTSTNYCSGTSADDVVAHEWTHAYTQETSGLIYSYQSGALNESYSDVFGETVDLINNRDQIGGTTPATGNNGPRSQDDAVCSSFTSEVPTADESVRWLMGEDAFAFAPLPPIGDTAIRDMWRPRCAGGNFFLGNPGHSSSNLYHCTADDGGGVHTNSSINNRAYALLVDGDTVELKDDGTPFANPVTVTGIGITKAAHIFWRANSLYNGPASNFADNADSLLMACQDLIGVNLRKLVTNAENGTGFLGANDDTIDPTTELSGEVITASDCQQVVNAIAAVEMRYDVAEQCGFTAPLDPTPAPMCGGATVTRQFDVDWESGIPAGWTIGSQPLLPTSTLATRPWFLRSGDLPKGKLGRAMYQENRVDLGNCTDDDESGTFYLISPDIAVAADGPGFLTFEHYFLTEAGFDGGNLMISINGGVFTPVPQLAYSVVPGSAFVHNPYNATLNDITDQNTNPKRGEEAFTGANPVTGDNNWGESQIDLAAAGVAPGDTIRLRWDFGQDGCNGNDGWYVDRIQVFTCGDDGPPPPPPQECDVYPADIPLTSPILPVVGSTTTATVSGAAHPVTDVNIRDLKGTHSYMGDLVFKLMGPSGTEITLFDGANCAGEDGIDVEFDDGAAKVIGCRDWLTGGSFRPQEALAAFNGQGANGDWTLSVTDGFPLDEGTIDSWSLELCRDLPPPPADGDGNKATGGGWLGDTGGGKINFGFNARETESGFAGDLELNDKGGGVKIHMSTMTSLGPVQGSCGAIADSPRALEFRGTGSFNKNASASFRVCVEDNGEPGNSHATATPDRMYLECTAGCSYNLAARAADAGLDGGNLQVRRVNAPPPAEPPQPGAATLILDPVLLTEGLIGSLQAFEVTVYGSDQEPLAGQNVSLTRVLSNGATQTLNGIAGPTGKALFNVTLATKPGEYQAASGNVGSNAVHVTPLLH